MTDTCSAFAQAIPKGTKVAALDSAKQAHYLPAIMNIASRGYDFVAEIAPEEKDLLLPKKHPSAFFGTPLASYLIERGIDTHTPFKDAIEFIEKQQAADQSRNKQRGRRNQNWVETIKQRSDEYTPAQHREPEGRGDGQAAEHDRAASR